MMRRLSTTMVGAILASLLGFSPGAAQQDPAAPKCGNFFENWEVPGVPANMLIMGGIGREIMAAQERVQRRQLPTACEHYRRILKVIDKNGADLPALNRSEVESLMRQTGCPL